MNSPPAPLRLLARHSRALAASTWLLPRAVRKDVRAVLAQMLWMEFRLERLLAEGGAALRDEVIAFTTRLAGGGTAGQVSSPLLHPAWEEAARRRALPGHLLVEYLDGLNIRLVQAHFRDRVVLEQFSRKLGVSAARLLASALDLPVREIAKPLDALGRYWVQSGLLLFWMRDAGSGRILFPLDELAAAGVSAEKLLADNMLFEREPYPLLVYRQDRAEELAGLLEAAGPALDAARQRGVGAWVESLLAWREVQLAEFRRKSVAWPSRPGLLAIWRARRRLPAPRRS